MFRLISGITNVSVASVAIVMGVGFAIGVYGHVIKNKPVIIVGIVMVGVTSAFVAFGLAKVAG